MDEQAVRDHAQAHCDALRSGDIERATQDMSAELRRSPGQVLAMLPMPLVEATVESVERTASGFRTTLHLVGESTETRLEARWKDRDGQPTIVEVSHMTDVEGAPAEAEAPPPEEG